MKTSNFISDEDSSTYERSVILLLVEGPADAIALKRLYQQCYPEAIIELIWNKEGGDITTKFVNGTPVTGKNILNRVSKQIYDHLEAQNKQNLIDGCQIIHIIDTDGAWIDDKLVVESATLLHESPQYDDTCIRTNPGGQTNIRRRNSQKKINTENLRWTFSIDLNWQQDQSQTPPTPPSRFRSELPIQHDSVSHIASYRIYYMSCNLDHVLHGQANLPKEEKKELARTFSNRYKDNPEAYVEFLRDLMPNFDQELQTIKRHRRKLSYVDQIYEATWEYIQRGSRSLKRCTNVWLSFDLLNLFEGDSSK